MVPVFTSFCRKTGAVKLDIIEKYAEFLKKNGVEGILVNGTTGEGICMDINERKAVAEAWVKAAKTTKQTIMIQVGGCCLKEVKELARHAESLGVSSILCLPELYLKPNTVDELVSYLYSVSTAAPNTPLLYYHIPSFTKVNLNMEEFLKVGSAKIPTLSGAKLTFNDLQEGSRCLEVHNGELALFLGSDELLAAAYFIGFDSSIATTLNMFADLVINIQKKVNSGENAEALALQKKLTKAVLAITQYGSWVPTMKVAMNLVAGFDFGEPREPQVALTEEQIKSMKKDLNDLGFLNKK